MEATRPRPFVSRSAACPRCDCYLTFDPARGRLVCTNGRCEGVPTTPLAADPHIRITAGPVPPGGAPCAS